MNTNVENTTHCSTYLECKNMQLQEKTIPHDTLAKPWELVGADISVVNNETLFFIVDYYSMFPGVKKVGSILAEDKICSTKVVFAKFGLCKKFVSDAGTNVISQWFKQFCRCLYRSSCNLIVSLPRPWTGGGMYKAHEMQSQEMQREQ